jgi:hypothetical protein
MNYLSVRFRRSELELGRCIVLVHLLQHRLVGAPVGPPWGRETGLNFHRRAIWGRLGDCRGSFIGAGPMCGHPMKRRVMRPQNCSSIFGLALILTGMTLLFLATGNWVLRPSTVTPESGTPDADQDGWPLPDRLPHGPAALHRQWFRVIVGAAG